MPEVINVYCDESCHLERDQSHLMMLGAVWCPAEKSAEICERVREIKSKNGLPRSFEVKWTKISPSKIRFYIELVDFFFDDDDLHFRGYLIEKTGLDHASHDQTHNDWYYKMCFRMLEAIIDPSNCYSIYLDIKDTQSERKRKRLEDVLRNKVHDHTEKVIAKVQQIRSHESELMQLSDLLLGAVLHHNRVPNGSGAKRQVIERIQKRSRKSLTGRTWLLERKFNLFRWHPTEGDA